MTAKKLPCTVPTFARIVDAASLSRDLGIMQEVLAQSARNGVCQAFAKALPKLPTPPLDRKSVLQGNSSLSDAYQVTPGQFGVPFLIVGI